MSQLKVWTASQSTTARKPSATGDGHSTRLYIGHAGSSDYLSYIKFNLDWSDVGRIVSATLVWYSEDGGAIETGESAFVADTKETDPAPAVIARILTSEPKWGNNANTVFDSSDYTLPTSTLDAQHTCGLPRARGALARNDITEIVNRWAPANVKTSHATSGGGKANHGLGFYPKTGRFSAWSKYADAGLRPTIELVYEQGLTIPNTPTNLTPTGTVSPLDYFEGDFSDTRKTDSLSSAAVEVYKSDGTTKVWSSGTQKASETERVNARFHVLASGLTLLRNTTYKWRARVTDNQGQVSAWSALQTVVVSNNAPSAPVLSPATGKSVASLSSTVFGGGFVDADAGAKLFAYQVQLSAEAEGSPFWDDPSFLHWNTGKRYVAAGATSWGTGYGGDALLAGTYTWRARVWDQYEGVSDWSYATVTLVADFDADPSVLAAPVFDPHAPRRLVVRDMGSHRGPGKVVAIIEAAKAPGFSIVFNSPGECHFTLPVDHPQISQMEIRQRHLSWQFYSGDGWREVWAGLLMDFDATETNVVFYGIDYLGLFDSIYDMRFDPAYPDLPYTAGGSKYVDKTLTQVITDQLTRATDGTVTNSPVDFISVGPIATMNEKVTIWSTGANCLQFVSGLIDSHRQGTGKTTRIKVRQKTGGGYEVVVLDDPGIARNSLRLHYGELVQGYRVIPLGANWASTQNVIGRTREGLRVLYKTFTAPGLDQSVWGNFSQLQSFDGVSDENDLIRRGKQAAIHAGKFGQQVAISLRSGFLQPLAGYDVCDSLPIEVIHGAVDTTKYGSGYWTIWGVAWEGGGASGTDDSQDVILTLAPREDSAAPDTDLIPTAPISPQAEWQIGWQAPDPLTATGKFWLDQTTGIRYQRQDDGTYAVYTAIGGNPSAPATPSTLALTSAVVLDASGNPVVRVTATVTQPVSTNLHQTVVYVTGPDSEVTPVVIPAGQTAGAVPAAVGGGSYSAVAVSYDVFGNASAATAAVLHTAAADTTAPGVPADLTAYGAILGMIVTWTGVSATDLDHYEVALSTDGGSTYPTVYKSLTTVLSLTQLAAATYYVKVRAVDSTGNASAYATAVSATARTVATTDLTDLAITTAKLAALSVTSAELAASAVTTAKIAADAVTAAEIATGAVGSSELAAGAVIAGKITAGTIVAADIAAGTITGAKIAATTIAASNIVAGTITANEIAAATITGAKIAAATITASNIAADTITANEIAAGAITASELDALSVTTAKLAAGAVTAAKITAGTITTTEIASGTITASNIAADTITANEIAASAITSSELAANAVIAGKIAAGTIVAADIAANALTVGKMAQNSNNEAANGGFEYLSSASPAADTFAGSGVSPFTGWSTGDSVVRVAYTETNPHGGGRAALIKASSAALARYTMEKVPVVGGRKYRASYWYRGAAGNNAGAVVQAFLHEYDVSGATVATTNLTSHAIGTTTTWTQESVAVVLNAATVSVDFQVRNGGTALGDIVGADDVEIYPLDYDLANNGGTVTIDSTGITISSGALTIKGDGAETVATSAGFAGGWLDFIRLGLYNARFLQGTAGAIANGRTSALPYWTLSNVAGSPIATFLAAGGVKVTFAALSNKKRLVSDKVPVVATTDVAVLLSYSDTWAAGTMVVDAVIEWYQSDGSTASATATTSLTSLSVTATHTPTLVDVGSANVPTDAFYAKVRIDVSETGTHNAGNLLNLLGVAFNVADARDHRMVSGTAATHIFDELDTDTIRSVTSGTQWGHWTFPGNITVTTPGSIDASSTLVSTGFLTIADVQQNENSAGTTALTAASVSFAALSGLTAGRRYLLLYAMDVSVTTVSAGTNVIGDIFDGSSVASPACAETILAMNNLTRNTISAAHIYTPTNTTLSLRVKKSAAAGVANLNVGQHTYLIAISI